jgi:serine/threonine protein kinase
MENGPYELLEIVGRGGMGTVYRARCRSTGQIVAVKLMASELASAPVLLKRFEQEFRAASRLRHPNMVPGLDFGIYDERPYLTMEFVEGPTLAQRVKQHGPLSVDEAVVLFRQVAEALQLAHENQFIHRDVKPENIMLARYGQAKLIDLGLIKDLANDLGLTSLRASMGTSNYMAPEQFHEAKYVNARCDIYGLGAALYFALTGLTPFQSRGPLGMLRKKLLNEFVPPRLILPQLGEKMDQLICRALDAESGRRPGSCAEFIDGLLRACEPGGAGLSGEARQAAEGDRTDRSSAAPERRVAPRHTTTLSAHCHSFLGMGEHQRAEITDVSLTGARLRLGLPFKPGTLLAVELMDEKQDTISSRWARVCWVQGAISTAYSLGCAFTHPLSDAELQSLLDCQVATVIQELDPRSP